MTWPDVMVTAHRRLPLAAVPWLHAQLPQCLTKLAEQHGMTRAITGMATGGDQIFGTTVQELGLPLRAAIPYPEQYLDGDSENRFGRRWSRAQRATWHQLKEYAEATGGAELVYDHYPRSSGERVHMLHKRNDWMLTRSQAVVALWDPTVTEGGTYSCIVKAVGAGMPVILFDLSRLRISLPTPPQWAHRLGIPALAVARPLW